MRSIVSALHTLEDIVIKSLMVWVALLVLLDVVLRFVFNTGLIWLQEVTLYSSAWFVLLGASWGVRCHAHIGVTLLTKKLPPATAKITAIIAVALYLVYCGLFLYGSTIYVHKMYLAQLEMEDLKFPKWIPLLALPIGFISLGLRGLGLLYKVLTNQVIGFGFHDEAKDSTKLAQDTEPNQNPSPLQQPPNKPQTNKREAS